MENSSKIKIKIGTIEVEFEGTESFIQKELLNLLKALTDLYEGIVTKIDKRTGEIITPRNSKSDEINLEATTGTIATKLGSNNAGDLITAAMTHLKSVKNKDKSSRKDINDEMKTASGYYKKSYTANLSFYLKSLIKDGSIKEITKDVYALDAKKYKEILDKLG